MQSEVKIPSDGLVLHGVLQMPEDAAPGESRAAFVVCMALAGTAKSRFAMTARVLDKADMKIVVKP